MDRFAGKRILYVWKDQYPWDVRAEKVCLSLIEAGSEVFMLARNKGEALKEENINGIEVIRVGNPKRQYLTLPVPKNPIWGMALKFTIEDLDPDLIIVREIMLAESVCKYGKKYGIPVIMDMAEHYPAAMRDWKKYNKTALSRLAVHTFKIPDFVEKKAVALCDGIIVVCAEQVERLANQYKYHWSKMCVVHNTPDLSYFENAKKYSSKPPKVFCHHGHLTAEKSILNLLTGFELAADGRDIKLIIAGGGECEQDYRYIVSKFKNKNKIEFTGAYNYESLPNILGKADIGVIPYQISDFNNYTIHNKIFDYFALGKPVLTSLANPLIRITQETKAGISSDFSNAETARLSIEKMLSADTESMSQNAYKFAAEKYNWQMDSFKLKDFISNYLAY